MTRRVGLPSFFINHLVYASSHSHENVPFAASLGRAPVLILSAGIRGSYRMSTTTAEALASHGYVVVAVEHTYDAAAVAFPDGSVALTKVQIPADATYEEDSRIKASWLPLRMADVRFVVDTLAAGDQIPEVLIDHIDAARVGVFGHSLGGATAAEACRTDARVVACADIDGTIHGEANTLGLAQPFLLIQTDTRVEYTNDFFARLRGPSCRLNVAEAMHMDFTDVPRISPLLQYLVPRMGRSEDSAAVLREANRAVTAFFDATLRGDAAGWSRVKSPHPRFSSGCERLPPS
jgi:dienelactone hydrolase